MTFEEQKAPPAEFYPINVSVSSLSACAFFLLLPVSGHLTRYYTKVNVEERVMR